MNSDVSSQDGSRVGGGGGAGGRFLAASRSRRSIWSSPGGVGTGMKAGVGSGRGFMSPSKNRAGPERPLLGGAA